MAQPTIPTNHLRVNVVPAKTGEIIKLGPIICRVMEDGSNTGKFLHSSIILNGPKTKSSPDNRIGVAEFTLPPNTTGPPAHWHEMHDEIFLTLQGTVRFRLPSPTPGEAEKLVDAKVGDMVTVPIRAPHTFSNPTDQEAKFLNTYTPAFYINYFKMLGEMLEGGGDDAGEE
jgi:mannose-6-phosphate isomerase-like protein (cupin superfamily)